MPRRIVSRGDSRIVVQQEISSGPSSFVQFCKLNASFVDKTLAIEAFLRDPGSHHLILRPRRCGKSYTLDMIREFLERPPRLGPDHLRDITTSRFESTAITGLRHRKLVETHFQQYPVLYIDLKDVRGSTFKDMLDSFDAFLAWILHDLSNSRRGILDQDFRRFCEKLCDPQALPLRRSRALQTISQELETIFGKPVVVLIDEYDSPMHSAIEHGYAVSASEFFATVFGSLLKNNNAVCASMMVGVCKIAKSGWLSQLNHIETFPMHAEDDRYAKFFLFTEMEVEILCGAHERLSIEALRPRYDGYAARCNDGLVKLYNPLSVVKALEKNMTSNFWLETGKYAPLSQNLWRAGPEFRVNLDLLLTNKSVKLVIDDNMNFLSYNNISDPALWGLLYYAGYLTIQDLVVQSTDSMNFGPQSTDSTSVHIFRIPNVEVTSEWHRWVVGYLKAKNITSLSGVYDTIIGGDAGGFQRQFTAFLQEYLALYCTPHHKEKVYQALCYMLIFALFGNEYDVRMEQDAGHGQSDITAHPFSQQNTLALIFQIKAVARHSREKGKRTLKTPDRITKELEKAKTVALKQIEDRGYRARVPLHAKKVHEYAFVFCGKFCVAAVRTFGRNAKGDWQQVTAGTTRVSEYMGDIGGEVASDEEASDDGYDEDARNEDEDAY